MLTWNIWCAFAVWYCQNKMVALHCFNYNRVSQRLTDFYLHLSRVIWLDADPDFYLFPCSTTDNDLTSYPRSPCDGRLSAHLSIVINVTVSRVRACACVCARVCLAGFPLDAALLLMEDKRSVLVSAGLCSSVNWINWRNEMLSHPPLLPFHLIAH